MEEMETNVVSGAESPEVAESHSDDEFIEGFAEEFGIEFETETEEPTETEPEEEKEAEAAESGEKEAESEPEMISFTEAGKKFSAPKEAVETFAKAVGRSVESIIDVYQKGCNYDKLNEKLNEALKDSEAFEKVAESRGMDRAALRAELLATLENAKIAEVVAKIKEENPGISDNTASELAKFRLNEQKPKAEAPKEESEQDSEETAARLREIEMFITNHPEVNQNDLFPDEVLERWRTTGIALEEAYKNYQNKILIPELEKKIAELEKANKLKDQKNYAREHGAGSATTAAGKSAVDPFVEGLFAEY